MNVIEIATLIVALAAIAGVIYSIWRNGKAQSNSFTELKTNLNNVMAKLNNPDHGLDALGQKLGEFKVHCAKLSSSLAEQVKSQQRELTDLKARRRVGKSS